MQRCLTSLHVRTPSTSGRVADARPLLSPSTFSRRLQHSCGRQTRKKGRQPVQTHASLTLRQRWLTVKHDVYAQTDRLRSWVLALPPIAAIIRFIRLVREFLDPYVRRYEATREVIGDWWALRRERYREFIGDETKRQWQWQLRHEGEGAFWAQVVRGLFGFLAVIFYETITPVNIIITVLVPLWVAWAFSKNILKSPILWGIIVMLPLKYPPGIPIWF